VSCDLARGDVTRYLLAWSAGDDQAAAPAFSALYETLDRLAERALSRERPDHTLEPSGLVGETFFRMLEQRHTQWRSREHFIAAAAQMMRRILIDHARSRNTAKRGDGAVLLSLADAALLSDESLDGLIMIHDALETLAEAHPSQSEIVELRFFGGMSHDEIARHLGLSVATVERRWRVARAWLYRQLKSTMS
jgi:RNA polymerase sigma factor (TIGR02999 family)